MYDLVQVGLTALIVASLNGHKDVVETLLEAEAKPDIQDQVIHVYVCMCGCVCTCLFVCACIMC